MPDARRQPALVAQGRAPVLGALLVTAAPLNAWGGFYLQLEYMPL